jgi:predicted HNH restriction endonuclease
MSNDNKASQFTLSLESLIETKIQQKMAEIRAAAYREAFSDFMKQQGPSLAFGDFLLNLNQQKQEFIDYVHALTLSDVASMMGHTTITTQSDSSEELRRLRQERDQAREEAERLKASKESPKEKDNDDASRTRRSSEEVRGLLELYKPKIFTFLQGRVPQSVADIAHGLSADPDDFKRALYELLEEKKIEREGERRGAKYFVP